MNTKTNRRTYIYKDINIAKNDICNVDFKVGLCVRVCFCFYYCSRIVCTAIIRRLNKTKRSHDCVSRLMVDIMKWSCIDKLEYYLRTFSVTARIAAFHFSKSSIVGHIN